MEHKIPIPRKPESFSKCIISLIRAQHGRMFQSELKKETVVESWYRVVIREIEFWNNMISSYYPGYYLVSITRVKNPKTGKANEVLFELHPQITIEIAEDHFIVTIKRGDTNMTEKNKPPIESFSAGAINVAVWENKAEATNDRPERTFHSVTFERRYKDKEDNWKGTAQLRQRDLLPAAHLFHKAFDYLLTVEKEEPEEERINE